MCGHEGKWLDKGTVDRWIRKKHDQQKLREEDAEDGNLRRSKISSG